MMYEDLNRYSEALDSYQKAYELNPENKDIQANLNSIKQNVK